MKIKPEDLYGVTSVKDIQSKLKKANRLFQKTFKLL